MEVQAQKTPSVKKHSQCSTYLPWCLLLFGFWPNINSSLILCVHAK